MPDPAACVSCRQRPAETRWRPFCSERCKMVDLGRWLREDYRVPGDADLDGDGPDPDRLLDDESPRARE